jgi:hypothetical protein
LLPLPLLKAHPQEVFEKRPESFSDLALSFVQIELYVGRGFRLRFFDWLRLDRAAQSGTKSIRNTATSQKSFRLQFFCNLRHVCGEDKTIVGNRLCFQIDFAKAPNFGQTRATPADRVRG